ncbi:hypothetical protein HNO86_28070 [Pseudomonas sp. C1C7]|uniref:dermonecrotic toxin domain-containing protein n=1 Tax=Pseudomonas sp. C1C7 TaxID=2735272 RepID=UPI001586E890|nr:DUF6543 domain-containing protein [Pseudomonas sp. C1C7]NUT78905.1 hypothetical protein [Pseudomonas sp. C1C7]
MTTSPAPLFFPEALKSSDRWAELGKIHGLTHKQFQWLSHLKLPSQKKRSEQTPPMHAERIQVSSGSLSVPLAGCFVLSATPDDKGEILYTPHAGIKKFASRTALSDHLQKQLDSADEDHDLLAFMSLSARKTLAAASDIKLTFQTIDGDIFEDQSAVIQGVQRENDQAMIDELRQLPSLNALLDSLLQALLKADLAQMDQRRTQAGFYIEAEPGNPASRHLTRSMSLSEALLWYYRHQRWPVGEHVEFTHPQRAAQAADQQRWDAAIKRAADSLNGQLSAQIQHFWNEASVDGATRRAFFARAIVEKARADLLLKRENSVITPQQWHALQHLIEPATHSSLTLETVRLWEYRPNAVELSGSLMISQDSSNAFLYTPAKGLQVLKDYADLKATLRKKTMEAGHDDELYDLMSLEERSLFIGFDQAQVSGAVVNGAVFTTLFEAIIGKQLQNLEYAFQVFRNSDGEVNIQAYFDKALDIRAMIGEQLLALDSQGRWSTRPIASGAQPSLVLRDTADGYVKTFLAVDLPVRGEIAAQPLGNLALQRQYLESARSQLAQAFAVALRGEAALREMSGSLRNADWYIVDTVFNPDRPDRKSRPAIRGFYPDAFSLVLECSGEKEPMLLANCVLLTERGGLDTEHSGRAILWAPGTGLEVFKTVASARQQLNQRLLDPEKRLGLLENLRPAQRKFHRRYSLDSLQLIQGNVLQHIAQSTIELFLARSEHIRSMKLPSAKEYQALRALAQAGIDTNSSRATWIAQAISQQQSMPAWLGLAPVDEQKLHVELLQQYRNNVSDDKDYLHGVQTLEDYVRQTLQTLLATRFPKTSVDPDLIEITPRLALAGPAQTLTQFALNHVNIAQGTGFRVTAKAPQKMPEGLNQAAVTQLLLSLNIHGDYAKKVTDALSGTDAAPRQLRFVKQLPWQLLQHAHALKLQRQLSSSAFDLILQVLDMPDATARAVVTGAHAIVRPLELIKTAGAKPVQSRGLYVINPDTAKQGPYILYAPYSPGSLFTEFDSEADLVSALNTPGSLRELLIRRLPDSEQVPFQNLLKSSLGETSEITLASSPIDGHLLTQLFKDNTQLLTQMLASQSQTTGQSDWEAVRQLFSSGIKRASGLLPGKLGYIRFLWQAFDDFSDSAEALQGQRWTRAIKRFIDGTAQMVSLGELSPQEVSDSPPASATIPVKTPLRDPQWGRNEPTAPMRTLLQPFEASTLALKDLRKDTTEGTWLDPATKLRYAAVAGKVYEVAKPGAVLQISHAAKKGPALLKSPGGQWVLAPDRHTVHDGKALSKMLNEYAADRTVRRTFNIEAQGMMSIRFNYPEKARTIIQAIDLARFYAFNSLHNLAQARSLQQGTRLDGLLRVFFDVPKVDISLLDKIGKAVIPLCKALVDPNEELLNTERFVVGSMREADDRTSAFVIDDDERKQVHFSDAFFNPQLEIYQGFLTEPFDIDGHAQAAILIHEFSHIFSKTLDMSYLEARRPFSDLIAEQTSLGAQMKSTQESFQRTALSQATPREQLFARWNNQLKAWISLDAIEGIEHVGNEILKITASKTMEEARSAFRNPVNPDARIAVILRNADSVAHLICQMGRQLDPAAS